MTEKKKTTKKAKKTTKKKKKKKVTKARPRGRPVVHNIDKIDLEKVEHAAGLGLTVENIAALVGEKKMSKATLERKWEKRPEIYEAIERGRAKALRDVAQSLYDRATGKTKVPDTKVFMNKDGDIITHEFIKNYPPDPQSAIFYLKTRGGDEWVEKSKTELTGEISVAEATLLERYRAMTPEEIAKRKEKLQESRRAAEAARQKLEGEE